MNVAKETVLSEDPSQAVRALVGLTDALIDVMEKEAHALATADRFALSVLQTEKEDVVTAYRAGAQELQNRVTEMRGKVAPNLLDELERAQNALGDITRRNNEALARNNATESEE